MQKHILIQTNSFYTPVCFCIQMARVWELSGCRLNTALLYFQIHTTRSIAVALRCIDASVALLASEYCSLIVSREVVIVLGAVQSLQG